jgi:hypothetical protein
MKSLVLWLGTGKPTPDDLVLEEKLKKATGAEFSELATHAENWPSEI